MTPRRSELLSTAALLASLLTVCLAFTTTYRIDTPDGDDDPSEGDDRIREAKAATQERLDVDHYWTASAANVYDDPDTGKHRFVTFKEPNDVNSVGAGEAALFTKDVNDIAELHFIDEEGNVFQITGEGQLLLGANDTYLRAGNAAEDGYADLIKADTDDEPVLADGAALATTADPNEDTDLIHKKYLDDRIAQYVKVSDVKDNADGGASTSATWHTRTLNTEDSDTQSLCSLAANQITLAAGTYRCRITAPAYNGQSHHLRLYNDTGEAVLLQGSVGYCGTGNNTVDLVGVFTVEAGQALEVQHYITIGVGTTGLGRKVGTDNSIYAVAEFWKIG